MTRFGEDTNCGHAAARRAILPLQRIFDEEKTKTGQRRSGEQFTESRGEVRPKMGEEATPSRTHPEGNACRHMSWDFFRE